MKMSTVSVIKFLLSGFCAGFFITPAFSQTPTYNTGVGTGGNTIPFYYLGTGCRGQGLYPVGVFGSPPSGMAITKLYWAAGSSYNGTQQYSNLHISLKQANISALSSTYETGMTQVYTSTNHTITYAGSQWFSITLANPFPYDPTLPLIWEVNQQTSGGSTWACGVNTTVPGAYRNYSQSYNTATASGSSAYMIAFGFDLAPASTARNDAGIVSIDSPTVFCPGTHEVVATVKNFGINQVDSVTINWTFNGITQSPVIYQQLLDTFGGAYPQSARVLLGTKTFVANQTDKIVAWTTLPNNQTDTVMKNDTARADKRPSISGNFTIDPSGSGSTNYVSFADAAKDLSDFGVCGPVTFEVASGTYNEQVKFNEIGGASNVNTISFFPETNGTVKVTYNSSTSDNYVINLNGADYVSFVDMAFESGIGSTYGTVIAFGNKAEGNSFSNCVLDGRSISTTSNLYSVIYCTGSDNNGNRFMNNLINNGSYGTYIYTGSSTATNNNMVFENNTFKNAYYFGAYFYGTKNFNFNGNSVKSNTAYTSYYGVYSYYSYEASEFIGNRIHGHYFGAYLYQYNGTATKQALIANNWISAENSTYYSYGLYYYGGFARIVHNTIWKDVSSTYGYYTAIIGGGANTFVNNILYTTSGSSTYYGYYANGTFAIGESDYNAFYNPVQYFGYFNGVINTFNDWKTSTGFDQNSIYTDPGYTDYDSLRTCNDTIEAAGIPLSYITKDIDGDDRDPMHPDIGADEWIGNDSGAYSAGPDQLVCDGKVATIGTRVTGGTFLWNTNETTPTIQVSTPGSYSVTMTTVCGGSHSDQVNVSDATPVATFMTDVSFLTGDFVNYSEKGNSYRWVVETIPPDTFWTEHLTYIFPNNGPYQVCLTVYNDCDTVENCATWSGTVGIAENSLDNAISIRPNPASDILIIQFNGLLTNNVVVEMTSVQGQLVYRDNYVNASANATKSIDVSSLNKGLYILKFITGNEVIAKRIVVQ